MSDFKFVLPTGVAGTLAGSPILDFGDGDTVSDTVDMSKYSEAYFMVFWGVGTTGQLTFTAIPSDDAAGSNTDDAISFEYKRVSSGETNTAWTSSSELETTAGSHQAYVIKVKAEDLPDGYPYVYINMAESTDGALLGGCLVMMAEPRYNEATLDDVTS